MSWWCFTPSLGRVLFMDSEDHVSDPICLCGSCSGWTPSVSLHRLWTQSRAPGEEAAAQDHQQGFSQLPWQSERQGPGAQHLVRIRPFQPNTLTLNGHNTQSSRCVGDHGQTVSHTGVSVKLRQAVCLLNNLSAVTCSASSLQRVYPTWLCATAASLLLRPSASWKICAGSSQHATITQSLPWQRGHIPFCNLVSLRVTGSSSFLLAK